jgi:signal transduction histidine kinase
MQNNADALRNELALVKEELATCAQALDARRQTIADLSHKLRTPLSTMVTWLEILQDERATESILREGLEVIRLSVQAQIKILDELADDSR